MTERVIIGLIPFYVSRKSDSRFLTPTSFNKATSGSCPVSWKHWREDNHVFRKSAGWLIDRDGLLVTHILDDTDPLECRIIQMVREQQLFWSYGLGAQPRVTRGKVAYYDQRIRPHVKREASPLEYEQIQHMAYVPESNFPMKPLWIFGE